MQKTAMLIAEMVKAVAHFSFRIVTCVSEMSAIRLMIICISSWISNTQRSRMKNNAGMLERNRQFSRSQKRKYIYM